MFGVGSVFEGESWQEVLFFEAWRRRKASPVTREESRDSSELSEKGVLVCSRVSSEMKR